MRETVKQIILFVNLISIVFSWKVSHKSILDFDFTKRQQDWKREKFLFVAEELNSKSVIMDVEHYNYLQIFARVQIGEQVYDLSLSNTTPDTFIFEANCSNCGPFAKGLDFGIMVDNPATKTISFEKFKITGKTVTLPIVINKQDDVNIALNQFRFFTVHRGEGLDGNLGDGVMGLGLSSRKGAYSIIDQLIEKSMIFEKQFSLFIADPFSSKKSQLVIGGLNADIFKNSSDIVWVAIKEYANDWTFSTDSLAFDSNHILAVDVEIRTDVTGLILSAEVFNLFVNYLLSLGIYCQYEARILKCFAMRIFYSFKLPEITVHVQGRDLHIPAELLLLDAQDERPGRTMRLSVSQEDISGVVVGIVLLRRYATIFDLENRRVGFYDSGYKTLKLMRELKFQLNLYNLLFAVMFGAIIAHFMIIGIKAIHLGAENFNFFEVNYFT